VKIQNLLTVPPTDNLNINIFCMSGKWYEDSQSSPKFLGLTLGEAITKLESVETFQLAHKDVPNIK